MDQTNSLNNDLQQENGLKESESLVIEAKKAPNSLLERLIREVRTEAQLNILAYNRTHNRHNRGR
ncbi:YhhA family cyclophane-containing RiPP [Spirosoma areae]